jgi:hypothetical protein
LIGLKKHTRILRKNCRQSPGRAQAGEGAEGACGVYLREKRKITGVCLKNKLNIY